MKSRALYWGSLLLAVVWLSYALFALIPADPARLMLGPNATQQAVERLRESLGLNRSEFRQLVDYTLNVLTLDFGQSLIYNRPVGNVVAEHFGYTAAIGMAALILSMAVCYSTGLIVFVYPQLMVVCAAVSKLGAMLPAFLLATLATAILGNWFPTVSLSGASFSLEGLMVGLIGVGFFCLSQRLAHWIAHGQDARHLSFPVFSGWQGARPQQPVFISGCDFSPCLIHPDHGSK